MNDSYSRFAPFIREYIYREKWSALRGIQEDAAAAIFDGEDHLLIAAGTASGKTEAAFFPVLSVLDALFRAGEKPLVLYISPLKALINDQAQRLERLLRSGRDTGEAAIPVRRWHGDVDSNSKGRFVDDPSGVLLITPESLEALLLRRPRELGRIFCPLIFAVIDEVHVFMGSDRGSQLICQLARIEEAVRDHAKNTNFTPRQNTETQRDARCLQNTPETSFSGDFVRGIFEDELPHISGSTRSIRRIGLSATLGDYDGARRWLSQGSDLSTALVGDEGAGKELSLALDYHIVPRGKNKSGDFYRSLYDQTRNKRSIIFTNSRLEAEECAASLSAMAAALGEADIFQVHHGSVSALLRNEAEEQLKSGEGPQAICATATLELGIDIGDLDRIIQLGPPWSVSAFVQRLGRSGRRSGRAEMYFSVTGPSEERESAALPWELLRTMAVIQLYLEEKWIEPPEEKPLPFSLLVHQTLSILASLGEHSPDALARRVLSLPSFKKISLEDFRTLIAWLGECGCIGAAEEGTLILGLEGEHIVNRHSFYPVFPGEETFRVMLDGREIGTVNFVPDPLSVLAVGGQRWVVRSIDAKRREIWVAETGDEGNERLWRGRGGGTHSRIAETMRRILAESDDPVCSEENVSPAGASAKEAGAKYAYLSADARDALERGRRAAHRLGITDNLFFLEEEGNDDNDDYDDDERYDDYDDDRDDQKDHNANNRDKKTDTVRTVFLFPWTGSAGMRTIAALLGNGENKKKLRIVFLEEEAELYFRIETKLGLAEFRSTLAALCQKALAALSGYGATATGTAQETLPDLIHLKDLPYTDKYDYLLPPNLLAKQYVANMLDGKALEKLLDGLATLPG